MAKAAQSKELRAAFVQHERETKGQVKRLDRVFKIIGKPARGKTCAAINGITEEGSEVMTDFKGMPALDAGLLAAAQAVEHYEISRYGTLATWAEELGYEEAVELLEATAGRKEHRQDAHGNCQVCRQCRSRGRRGRGRVIRRINSMNPAFFRRGLKPARLLIPGLPLSAGGRETPLALSKSSCAWLILNQPARSVREIF